MIYITGDKHGDFRSLSASKFKEGKNLTKNDYVIILGDFSGLWYPVGHPKYNKDQYWIKWLEDKPFTTLFVDGNHENFDMLENLETVNLFNGNVGKVSESIYHLKRGEVYQIDGNKFFVFGGAQSTDQDERQLGKTYWKQEIFNEEEKKNAKKNLKKHNYDVDYILSHTCPSMIVDLFVDSSDDHYKRRLDPVSIFLEELFYDVIFYKWYFGHFHKNIEINDRFEVLYTKIKELP